MFAAKYGNFAILSKIFELGAFEHLNCVDDMFGDSALTLVGKRLGDGDWNKGDNINEEIEKCYQFLAEQADTKIVSNQCGDTAASTLEMAKENEY